MKKFKKLIALVCVATMLIPTVAFADESPSSSGGGDSVIENDNSVAPEYGTVVLPTVTEGTYDFKIDRDHLLADFDYEQTFDASSYIYFTAEDDPATAVNAAGDGNSLYLKTKTEDVSATNFLAYFTDATLTGKLSAATEDYYVWVPTSTDKTRGEFVLIDDTNVANIVEYDTVAKLRVDFNSGDFIWNGKIYYDVYNKLTDTDAVEYITVTDGAVSAVSADLYKAASTDATILKAAATAAATSDITYTAATTQYIAESDAATVVNKSTFPVVVSVQINMTNDAGITYVDAATIATDTENASLYFAIADEGTNTAVVANSTATAYYVLDGATNSTMVYQGKSDDLDPITGSHNYYQYEQPNPVYDEQAFTIVADVNDDDNADEAWNEYLESLSAENPKPQISVVYSWEKVEKATDEDGVVIANKYVDAAGVTYTATSASDGWATRANLTTTIVGNAYSLSSTTNTYTINWADSMSAENKKITKIGFSVDGTSYSSTLATTCYTLNGNTLTIDATKNAIIGSGAINNTRYFKVTFGDGSTTVIKLTNITA